MIKISLGINWEDVFLILNTIAVINCPFKMPLKGSYQLFCANHQKVKILTLNIKNYWFKNELPEYI